MFKAKALELNKRITVSAESLLNWSIIEYLSCYQEVSKNHARIRFVNLHATQKKDKRIK